MVWDEERNGEVDVYGAYIAAPGYLGDVDGDGDVDFNDFLDMQDNYGAPNGATQAMGDLDRDGDVDIFDFMIIQGQSHSCCSRSAELPY